MKILFSSILTFPLSVLLGQEPSLPNSFKTTIGIDIKNARVTGQTEDSVKVMHDGGIATIPFRQLPSEVLAALGKKVETSVSETIQTTRSSLDDQWHIFQPNTHCS